MCSVSKHPHNSETVSQLVWNTAEMVKRFSDWDRTQVKLFPFPLSFRGQCHGETKVRWRTTKKVCHSRRLGWWPLASSLFLGLSFGKWGSPLYFTLKLTLTQKIISFSPDCPRCFEFFGHRWLKTNVDHIKWCAKNVKYMKQNKKCPKRRAIHTPFHVIALAHCTSGNVTLIMSLEESTSNHLDFSNTANF